MGIDFLFFVDVETTGVSRDDSLLEVAVVATDMGLRELGRYEAVVSYSPVEVDSLMDACDDWVLETHDRTGLWDRLLGEDAKSLAVIDADLEAFYVSVAGVECRRAILVGNSCRLDANMVEAFLPRFDVMLHYSLLDISGLAIFAEAVLGVPRFAKVKDHSAMSDILESIDELKYLLGEVGVGPASDDIGGPEEPDADVVSCGNLSAGPLAVRRVGPAEFARDAVLDYERRGVRLGWRESQGLFGRG